jgi:hypothetical protein
MAVEVSVVVPSIGSAGDVRGRRRVFVVEAVRSVLATTAAIDREVVVVAGREMPAAVVDELCSLAAPGVVRCVPYDAEFNFSATVNLGAAHSTGRGGLLLRRRSVIGVTAACMLTPAAVYDRVGGFTTLLPGNYNDVDYCLKLRHAGYDIVYEPGAVLDHFESRSRIAGIRPEEVELIQRRWLSQSVTDPFTPAEI